MPIDKYMRLGTAYKYVKTFQWYTTILPFISTCYITMLCTNATNVIFGKVSHP